MKKWIKHLAGLLFILQILSLTESVSVFADNSKPNIKSWLDFQINHTIQHGTGECVPFVKDYVNELWGLSATAAAAKDFPCPRGWSVINLGGNADNFQLGDIVVEVYNPHGHVAVYYGKENGRHYVVDQNSGNGSVQYANKHVWASPFSASETKCYRPPQDGRYFSFTAPTVNVSVNANTVSINWNNASATSYYVYIHDVDNNRDLSGKNVGTSLSYTWPNSLADGNYTVYVSAYYGSYPLSGHKDFSVGNAVTHEAPTVNTTVNGKTVSISWNSVGASSYYVYIHDVDNNRDLTGKNVGTSLSYTWPNELANGNYTAYVSAYFGNTPLSGHKDFSILNPQTPTIPSVTATINGTSVDLQWTAANADGYELHVYNTDTGDVAFSQAVGTGQSKHLELSPGPWQAIVTAFFGSEMATGTIDFEIESPPAVFTVSYDANGGSGAPSAQTKNSGIDLTLSDAVPSRVDSYSKEYRISFNGNGGVVSSESDTVRYLAQYSFWNWNTSSDGNGTSYSPGATYSNDEDAVLYAQWNETETPEAIILPTAAYDGHTLLGWGMSPTAADSLYQAGDSFTSDHSLTLYAIWQTNEYVITYNANGGSGAPDPQSANYGANTLSSVEPSRSHYRFLGWSIDSAAVTVEYHPSDSIICSSDISLYAVWKINLNNMFVVPSSLTMIGDEAFIDTNADAFFIPSTVTSIGLNAFGDVIIYGYTNSYVENYASRNNLTFIPVTDDWVLEDDVPIGAQISDEKWTYTRSKTESKRSTNAALDGWTQTGFEWMNMGSWTHTYANYPDGFDTGHSLYSAYEKSALSPYETATAKRLVSESTSSNYIYWHWTYFWGTSENKLINDHNCIENGLDYNNFKAYENSYIEYEPGTSYVYWNTEGPEDGSCWWFRIDVLQQTYTDYQKLFTYSRIITSEETSYTPVAEGAGISNIQHWVKYTM